MLDRALASGHIHGVKEYRGASQVSHLLFADDSFFFHRATNSEWKKLKGIFQNYENVSCQAINFNKFGIFFSGKRRHYQTSGAVKYSRCFPLSQYKQIPWTTFHDW